MLVLRVAVGAVFLAHGIAKFQGGVDGVAGFFSKVGIPFASVMAWVVSLVETIGGAFLILGFSTQISAALIAFIMIVAVVAVKASKGFISGYELDVSLFAGAIALLLQGAGKYSVDAKICGGTCAGCCDGNCEEKK
jgi:uncharacterized membrane protein YphA (DoxX/SURF4 family)